MKSYTLNATPDSVVMGTGYANDIYYSFEDGNREMAEYSIRAVSKTVVPNH